MRAGANLSGGALAEARGMEMPAPRWTVFRG